MNIQSSQGNLTGSQLQGTVVPVIFMVQRNSVQNYFGSNLPLEQKCEGIYNAEGNVCIRGYTWAHQDGSTCVGLIPKVACTLAQQRSVHLECAYIQPVYLKYGTQMYGYTLQCEALQLQKRGCIRKAQRSPCKYATLCPPPNYLCCTTLWRDQFRMSSLWKRK